MKLAVLFFGISIENDYIRPCSNGESINIDYKISLKNYKEYIFDHFKNKGYEIDIFFSTNPSSTKEEQDELINTFKPINYTFVNNEKDNYLSKHKKLCSVTKLCLDSNIIYDNVLLTRFDLLFKKNFNSVNIDMNKFNLVTVLENPKVVCDNLYIMPYKMLDIFYKIIENTQRTHYIRYDLEKLIGENLINYIDPFPEGSRYRKIRHITFYEIVRDKK